VAQSFFSALSDPGATGESAAADEPPAANAGEAAGGHDPGAESDLVADDGSFDLSDFEI
jgi:hypothetical protein